MDQIQREGDPLCVHGNCMANSLLLCCQEAAGDRTQDALRGFTAISGRYPHHCSRVAIKLRDWGTLRQESTPICRSAAKGLSVYTRGYTGVTTSRVEQGMRILPSRIEDITCSQHLWITEAALRQYQIHIFIPCWGKTVKGEYFILNITMVYCTSKAIKICKYSRKISHKYLKMSCIHYRLLSTTMKYSFRIECIGKYSWHMPVLTEHCSDPTDLNIDSKSRKKKNVAMSEYLRQR